MHFRNISQVESDPYNESIKYFYTAWVMNCMTPKCRSTEEKQMSNQIKTKRTKRNTPPIKNIEKNRKV